MGEKNNDSVFLKAIFFASIFLTSIKTVHSGRPLSCLNMSVSLLFLKVFLSQLNVTFSHVRCRFWRYFIHRADVGKSLSVDKRFLETTQGDFCHCRHTEQVSKQQFGLTFRCLPSTSVHLWFYGDLWHILVISFYCTKHNELSTCRSSAAALE